MENQSSKSAPKNKAFSIANALPSPVLQVTSQVVNAALQEADDFAGFRKNLREELLFKEGEPAQVPSYLAYRTFVGKKISDLIGKLDEKLMALVMLGNEWPEAKRALNIKFTACDEFITELRDLRELLTDHTQTVLNDELELVEKNVERP